MIQYFQQFTSTGPVSALALRHVAWVPLVVAALLVIYIPSLGNALVFDDGYLADGELFSDYRSWLEMRARWLSYGSFVWLQSFVGDGWWKQRVFNLLVHCAVVVALWALYRRILAAIQPPEPELPLGAAPAAAPAVPYADSPALALALAWFALNPAGVYAVGYLIQRSILMATFFVVLALYLFVRAVAERRPGLYALAFGAYALAVLCKEHAILAPLAAVPLYILVARPSGKRVAILAAAGIAVVAAAALALRARYGEILGKPFDEYSHIYLAQLGQLDPGAPKHAFALSILNQAYLFFHYGVRWLLPFPEWMSINLRPPFPVTWLSFPHVLGIVGYVGVIVGGFFLLLRYRDWRALLGVSLLLPALLFATEFATVWVQDPFVLYRSYLWAIGIPGLVFVVAHGPSVRVVLSIGLVVGALLTWQSLNRVWSLATPETAWSDAIRKLPDDARSVGRWFPYLNRGAYYVERGQFRLAMRDFETSSSYGDLGMGLFNAGALLAAEGRHAEALARFADAEKQGYRLYNLRFQRGLSLIALGRHAQAYEELEAARAANPPSPTRELTWMHLGKLAMQLGKPAEAIRNLEPLAAAKPGDREAAFLLAMAYVMKNEPERARTVADRLLRERPEGRAYYARALAHYGLKRKAEAQADIEKALAMSPDNPNLREWQAKIKAMP